MKLIEALKEVEACREKIRSLSQKISENSAHREDKPTEYVDPKEEIQSWQTKIHAATSRMEELLLRISYTNLKTLITIEINGNSITKSIAGWVYRRRELSRLDLMAWNVCTNKRLRAEVDIKDTNKVFRVVLNYDPKTRDRKVEEYTSEPGIIDSRLETVNAVTELLELK